MLFRSGIACSRSEMFGYGTPPRKQKRSGSSSGGPVGVRVFRIPQRHKDHPCERSLFPEGRKGQSYESRRGHHYNSKDNTSTGATCLIGQGYGPPPGTALLCHRRKNCPTMVYCLWTRTRTEIYLRDCLRLSRLPRDRSGPPLHRPKKRPPS